MSDKILNLAAKRAEKIQAMETIVQAAENENRGLTQAEHESLETMTAEVDNMTRSLESFDKVARMRAAANLPMNQRAAIVPDIDESDFSIGMTNEQVRGYRMGRAIFAMAEQMQGRGNFADIAPLEFEASQAVAKKFGKTARSFFVPFEVLSNPVGGFEKRADMTTGAGVGAELIATDLLSASFIDVLRNATVIGQAGATMLTGLVGDIAIPRKTAGSTVYWVAEGNAPTESAVAFDQVTMSPNSLAAVQDYSKKLLRQSSLGVEAMLRRDLALSTAVEIDRVSLHGSGSGAEPQGINGATGVAVVPIADPDGGAPTWGTIVDLESEVGNANAAMGRLAYVTNSKVRGKLKKTETASGSGDWIWDKNNSAQPLNGYAAFVTNNVASNLTKGAGTNLSAIFFGDWTALMIGQWGELDIMVDPYTQGVNGLVRIVAFHEIDVDIRHGESFAVAVDAVTT